MSEKIITTRLPANQEQWLAGPPVVVESRAWEFVGLKTFPVQDSQGNTTGIARDFRIEGNKVIGTIHSIPSIVELA